MNIGVIGAGKFGLAIANQLSLNKQNQVIVISRCSNKIDSINSYQKVEFYNENLSKNLKATNDLKIIKNFDILFCAIPSSNVADLSKDIYTYVSNKTLIVNLSKGLIKDLTVYEFLKISFSNNHILTLKGPSFASELISSLTTIFTLGYSLEKHKNLLHDIFKNTCVKLDFSKDIIGVEYLSILKNVYSIFIGMVDYDNSSYNYRFLCISKILLEIKYLLKFFGGEVDTFFCSCGISDISMTALSDMSRNRTFGKNILKHNLNERKNLLAEGVNTLSALGNKLSNQDLKKLPILSFLLQLKDNNFKIKHFDPKKIIT
tara:strand:+ start:227 stop:1177 length:951 start_codon:yes stop_codon:yes gene_type:complete